MGVGSGAALCRTGTLRCYSVLALFYREHGRRIRVLLIVVAGWIILRKPDWFVRPGISGYVLMIAAGLLLAVLVEWVAVHKLERWVYAERMPTLPGLGIGVVPIAQMLILPPVIFRIAAIIGLRKK